MAESINRKRRTQTIDEWRSNAKRFLAFIETLSKRQKSVLAQVMEDFNAGKCTFEELKVRIARNQTDANHKRRQAATR